MLAKDLSKKLIATHLEIPSRLKYVVAGYVMSLMVESPKHTQTWVLSQFNVTFSKKSGSLPNAPTQSLLAGFTMSATIISQGCGSSLTTVSINLFKDIYRIEA